MRPGFVRILNFLGGMNLWRWGRTLSNDLILQTSLIFVVVRTANLSGFGHQSLSFLVYLENNMTFYGVTPQIEGRADRVCHRVFAEDSLEFIFARLSIIKGNIGTLYCTTPLALFVGVVEQLHCNSIHRTLDTCFIPKLYLPSFLHILHRQFSPIIFFLLWQPDIFQDILQIIAPILSIILALVRVPGIEYCRMDGLYALLLIFVLLVWNAILKGEIFQIIQQPLHQSVPEIIKNSLPNRDVFLQVVRLCILVRELLRELSGELVCILPHIHSPSIVYFVSTIW